MRRYSPPLPRSQGRLNHPPDGRRGLRCNAQRHAERQRDDADGQAGQRVLPQVLHGVLARGEDVEQLGPEDGLHVGGEADQDLGGSGSSQGGRGGSDSGGRGRRGNVQFVGGIPAGQFLARGKACRLWRSEAENTLCD